MPITLWRLPSPLPLPDEDDVFLLTVAYCAGSYVGLDRNVFTGILLAMPTIEGDDV